MGYSIEDAREEILEEKVREEEERKRDYEKYLSRRRQLRWSLIAACVSTSVLGVFFVYSLLRRSSYTGASEVSSLLTIIVFGVAFGGAALIYLRPTSSRREITDISKLQSYVDFRVDELLSNRRNRSSENDKRDKQLAIELLRKRLEDDAIRGFLDQIKAEVAQTTRRDGIDARLQATQRRLGQEVQDLARRGNLNLVLGILTTLAGLSTLAYAVITSPLSNSIPDNLVHFMPRLSLAFLIEVFAYFFLKLYKQTLGEIKYFQNELTNVESKAAAAMFAFELGNTNLFEKVVLSLSDTERNFVLQKGQTTVELERDRLASKDNVRALNLSADTAQAILKTKNG